MGLRLEVGPRRGPRLLVWLIIAFGCSENKPPHPPWVKAICFAECPLPGSLAVGGAVAADSLPHLHLHLLLLPLWILS